MLAIELIRAVEQAGGHLEPDGDGLVIEAPEPLPEPIMTELRTHKAEVLIALASRPKLSPVSKILIFLNFIFVTFCTKNYVN